MCGGGCERCVEETVGDVRRRLWEMCGGGCRRCVEEAVGDVWGGCGRCAEEAVGGGCGRCVDVLCKLKYVQYN